MEAESAPPQPTPSRQRILRAVSHDLRSPLTAIRAAAEGLESRDVELSPEDEESLVATIRTETRRLERLVANFFLDLSRLEVGAATPRPELWTVDDLVGRALEELGAEGSRVVVSLDPELPRSPWTPHRSSTCS